MSVPRAVYRLQLSPQLNFAAVAELVPYLRDLGVSHLYLSPSLQARSGSTHGYDVVDPSRVSEPLGGEEGLRSLAAAGLGIVLDIVPNHMGVGDENPWWTDESLRPKYFDYDPADGWYRRFFDIDDLVGLRVEDPDVFAATHGKILQLVREGVIDGLRVDHPDGLADPAAYLRRLRDEGAQHVWVEKILSLDAPAEQLPDWPVEGTVGYEFLNDATALFVDPAGEAVLTRLAAEVTGESRPFHEIALEAQVLLATTTFAREIARLRTQLDEPGIADAMAALPRYRTYVEPATGPASVSDDDRAAIAAADMSERLQRVLTLQERGHDEFVTRFQQTSPPVTAKGIEDTAFYRDMRLTALNEVGGEPARFSLTVADFHAANALRARRFPHNLLETQTHDTKRSGDVRARIGALAGMAEEWRERVLAWRELTADLRADGIPDATEEYLIYQTLAGAWPISAERLGGYLVKALREGKRTSSWAEPDERHEARTVEFATALLTHRPFLDDFEPFLERVVAEGRRSALAQLLLKLTVPGVPDVYQGDELEALSLVDPDNRRPVDWELRRRLLASLRDGAEATDETRKLDLIVRALALRERRPASFTGGSYLPLEAGPGVCAFARGDDAIVVVGVRAWDDAVLTLPPALFGSWRSVLADRGGFALDAETRVDDLVDAYGLALLERDS
ncbi:malto-oligosyltrehalose synthase [Conexibacter sp. CPCC 206217]|uniref:malto-oligosyltrehalose synthase n=1 Tax=Conexibacter sp. CPCC 206217 TaxID=3064574 RepID=UPI002719175E|nr:malto-oligosyltrehalose synthase [Conexibacter sp. CPCC 206217]MDO8213061.1 malto-oligosyltrehalose synthase [Conexibacter sp. CPCC 206217]